MKVGGLESSRDYAELAASVLKRKPVSQRETGLTRDRGIAVVAQAMRQASRARQRSQFWYIGLAAAAAAAVLVVSVHTIKKPAPAPVAHAAPICADESASCSAVGNAAPVVDVGHLNGRDVMPGSVLQADSGKTADVHFDSGTRLSLDANTMMAYDEGTAVHRFSLSRGTVHWSVAKLTRGQRFLLNTLDAEVEVRGTVFNVKIIDASQGCGQRTQVSVDEGVVEVRTASELHTLRAGETWPGDCANTSTQSNPHSVPAVNTLAAVESRRAVTTTAVKTPSTSAQNADSANETSAHAAAADSLPKSALAQQNDLYARASAERHLGHSDAALSLYQQLITSYPGSALVESAYVQRLRILRQTRSPLAKIEAERYLQLFTQGFARAEAAAIIDAP